MVDSALGGSFTRRPSSSSVYLRCQNSSRAVTIGISAKLYSGGGDERDPLERAGVPRVFAARLAPLES